MTHIVSNLLDEYKRLMDNGDERLKDWPLMKGPLSTITICLSYVAIVKYIGPQLMKGRQPFNIRNLMIAYNIMMVILSAVIVYVFAKYAWFKDYSLKCQPVDYSSDANAYLIAKTSYFYYALKFLEFFDTIFFVLRKKYSHVSTLHVIHHGIMPFSVWWGLKFVPGGHATFFGFINSFVHVIMYTYYALAAFGPHMYKYLWWKKYLTTIQMIQFIIIFAHSMQLFFYDCKFPKVFGVWIGLHGVLFWFLFSHFYKKTYLDSNKRKKMKSDDDHPQKSEVKDDAGDDRVTTNQRTFLSDARKFASICSFSDSKYAKLIEDEKEDNYQQHVSKIGAHMVDDDDDNDNMMTNRKKRGTVATASALSNGKKVENGYTNGHCKNGFK